MDLLLTQLGSSSPVITAACLVTGVVCTAAYKIICKYLDRHKSRKIIIEADDKKIVIEAHTIEDEKVLLKNFIKMGWAVDNKGVK